MQNDSRKRLRPSNANIRRSWEASACTSHAAGTVLSHMLTYAAIARAGEEQAMGSPEGGTVVTEFQCPECHSRRTDPSVVCPTCGAPPMREGDKRALDEEVRSQDLEPYVTLRYIARLFKVLAALMVVMLIGEII